MPSFAFGWGPLTHIYLGSEIFSFAALLPPAIFEVIRRHRKDFLYGTIMADTIIGKQYLPDDRNPHSWEVGFDLLKSSRTSRQKAFVYGYLSHLAADTVAHNVYTAEKKDFGHTVMEMKADAIIDKKYWFQAMAIDRNTQLMHDLFLEEALDRVIFSFKTNKRILQGVVLFSVVNQQKIGDFIDRRLVTSLPDRSAIEGLHEESLDHIIDLFQNMENSEVLKLHPSGSASKGRIKSFIQLGVETRMRRRQSA
ncbi:MAG: zinc dependent phospholipase C family protein [Thermodesulfovibrionales bacterium]